MFVDVSSILLSPGFLEVTELTTTQRRRIKPVRHMLLLTDPATLPQTRGTAIGRRKSLL